MSDSRRAAARELFSRIMKLHSHGIDSEEIGNQILDTEPETALFLTSLLVEILLDSFPHQQVS